MNISLQPLGVTEDESIEVSSPHLSIGRSDMCDLQLHHGMVSRRHAELIVRNDEVLIRDLESSNGTFVNGDPVADVRRLRDGDVLSFAVVPYEIHIEGGIRDRVRREFLEGRFDPMRQEPRSEQADRRKTQPM